MNADWSRGIWSLEAESPEAAEADTAIRLTVGSDWLPLRGFDTVIKQDPAAIYGDLLPLLRQSDLNVVNVETTLGTTGAPIPKAGPNFRADEDTVRSLTEAPFHVACMANNHIMDYGPASLERTLHVLRSAGMQTVGAGMTGEEAARPLIVNAAGVRIAIVNCAEGEACVSLDNGPGARGLQVHRIARQIRRLQRENDFVLVIFHGGREYTPLPPEYVTESLRTFAIAGASAVIAHHPHVPQGLEWYNGVPIVYSLGNFVFLQEDRSFYRHTGYLVHLDIRGKRLSRMEITPYLIQAHGLTMMQGTLKAGFLSMLHTVSQLLADPGHVRGAWDAFIDSIGLEGMQRMLRGPLAKLDTELSIGAAQLQNVFFTPAHRNLLIRGLHRAAAGQLGDSPDWAKALVDHWLHCRIDEGIHRCQTIQTNNGFLPDSLRS